MPFWSFFEGLNYVFHIFFIFSFFPRDSTLSHQRRPKMQKIKILALLYILFCIKFNKNHFSFFNLIYNFTCTVTTSTFGEGKSLNSVRDCRGCGTLYTKMGITQSFFKLGALTFRLLFKSGESLLSLFSRNNNINKLEVLCHPQH